MTNENIKNIKTNENIDLLTFNELCDYLGIGYSLAYKLLRSGEIKSVRLGKIYRIPIASVNEYIIQNCETKRTV